MSLLKNDGTRPATWVGYLYSPGCRVQKYSVSIPTSVGSVVHEYSTYVTNASKPKGLEYQFIRLGGQNAAEDVAWRLQEQSCSVAATVFMQQVEFSAKFMLGN